MLYHSNCHSGRQDHFEVCTISVTCTWFVGHSSAARRKRPTSSKRRRRDFRDFRDFRDLGRAWNGWNGFFSCQASSSADVDMDDKAGNLEDISSSRPSKPATMFIPESWTIEFRAWEIPPHVSSQHLRRF